MPKIDHKKELAELYRPSAKEIREVVVPQMSYLMIDGHGNPNMMPAYAAAVEALYSVSYAAKFAIKKANPSAEYTVMPLEGLWWADDLSVFESNDRSKWQWTMMIMQPSIVTSHVIRESIASVERKKGLPALKKLRFEPFDEGRCAQIMHIGPFSEEGPTIQRVHEYILSKGQLSGKHHEIYLSDIRRADPKNWKTIIRQPMEAACVAE
ncbi:GyrI-like domain-containing protein [Cerasicoccus maritimus]|uniref:GyrI-like domain-containing protein n=1 Tax=Cerasicoccus maritimus TaxID=490089 RepID=UPI0028529374|nr:GyrI-like domain-containing protein [Cerasicoccus maritimus]